MSVIQYVMFLALVGLATFCQNLTGFAFGLIFVGVAGATHLMGIGDAANVACLLSVVNGVAYLRAHRQVPQWTLLKPMLISSGQNADMRYNFFYPRWAYDNYRQALSERAAQQGWRWLDAWDLVPETEFTNSAIHLTPAGEALLAQAVAAELSVCP